MLLTALLISLSRNLEKEVWFGFFIRMYQVLTTGRLVGRGSVSVSSSGLWGVDSGTFIGDLSNESVLVVSGVGGGLDTAIRKSNHEATLDNTGGILSFCLLEVSLAVVIVDSILISKWLRGELLWGIWGRGSIGWGSSSESGGHEGRSENDL